jgi:hypothetical protein
MTFREPVRATLLRNGSIAIIGGGIIAGFHGGLTFWPWTSMLVLWPALGGHLIELSFLNWLRPLLPREAQAPARIGVWFVGGTILTVVMGFTPHAPPWFRPDHWWLGGLAFILVELLVHVFMQLRGRPNFFNGRG